MAVVPRDDGLVDVTDPSGAVVLSGIPAEFAPPAPAAPPPAPKAPEPVGLYAEAGPPPSVPLDAPQKTVGLGDFMSPIVRGDAPQESGGLIKIVDPTPGARPEGELVSQTRQLGVTPEVRATMIEQRGGAAQPSWLAPGPGASAPVARPGAAQPQGPGGPTSEEMARKYLLEQRSYGPVRKVPERDVLQSFSVKKGLPPLSEETEAGITGAIGRQAEVSRLGGEALALNATEAALAHKQRAAEARTEIASMREQEKQRQEQLGNRMSMLSRRLDEARSKTIDPDRYWKRKGTGGTILAKIGIALGAIGGGMTGRPNEVYQQIKDEWDADLAAQKVEIDQERFAVEGERSLLGEMRMNFQSQIAADNAARAVLAEATASEVAAMAAQQTSLEAQTRGQELAAKFQREAAEFHAKAEEAEADEIAQSWKHEQAKTVGGGGGPVGMDELIKRGRKLGLNPVQSLELATKGLLPSGKGPMNRADVEYAKDVRGRRVRLPNGEFAYATTQKAAEETQGVLEARSGLRKNFARQRALAASFGKSMSPEQRAEYEVLVQSNKLHMKKLEVLGAITEADQKLVSPVVGEDGQRFFKFDSATQATLDAADTHLSHQEEAARAKLYADPEATVPISKGLEAPPPEGAKKKK